MYIIACEYKLTLTIFCDTFHLAKMYNEDETKKKKIIINPNTNQPKTNKQAPQQQPPPVIHMTVTVPCYNKCT